MRKKSKARRRGRRAGVFASLAATAAMLVSSIGAAPAQAATNTAWIPLHCSIGGVIAVHVGAALTTTTPDSVAPGGQFALTGTSTTVIFPPAAQQGGAVFNGDAVQGIVQNFQTNLTGATVNFAATPVGPTQSSPTQFSAVRAVQPPNQAATGNVRINGGDTTRGGFQPATPAESFSFGDVPTDSSGATGNRFGPVPGVGGGPNPTDGTPDTLPDIGPITATGAAGTDIVIINRNPGGPDVAGLPAGNPVVADNTISFHEAGSGSPGTYGQQLAADCAFDVSANAVAKPVASWVDQITVPIVGGGPVDGEGSASARGTDPDATLGAATVAAQYSAITNCDEAASTRPFIVRWTNGGTHTFVKTGAADTSTCVEESGTNVNEGTATGTVDGTPGASVEWSFVDGLPSPDNVNITVTPATGDPLDIAGAPAALNGSPGGVWTFETTPWPAGGGA